MYYCIINMTTLQIFQYPGMYILDTGVLETHCTYFNTLVCLYWCIRNMTTLQIFQYPGMYILDTGVLETHCTYFNILVYTSRLGVCVTSS